MGKKTKPTPLNLLMLLCILLAPANCIAQSFYYVSPGFQVFYGTQNGLSFGAKISVGVMEAVGNSGNSNVFNITAGLLKGEQLERYAEIQYVPVNSNYAFMAGAGIGICSRPCVPGVGARVSFFSGMLLFEDVTYNYFGKPADNGFEFGSSIVTPILLKPPNLNFNLNFNMM
jgi:hypothetical protein